MNKRVLALLAVAVAVGALLLFDRGTPDAGVVEPVERHVPKAAAAGAPAKPGAPEPAILKLIPRAELIGADDEAMGSGSALFGTQSWNPPPPPPPPKASAFVGPPPPPPPPTAPPLPFTFLGKAREGAVWEVYLARGDKLYVVKIKDNIDSVYRVDSIAPPMMTFTYLPLNQQQTLNIGVFD